MFRPSDRGHRECRAAHARPQPCVRIEKAHKHSHYGHTGFTRHSRRNGFSAYFVLSLVSRALLPPSPAESSPASLTPASGRQNHTTSPTASCALVFRAKASTASRAQRLVTIAKRPSEEAGRKPYISASGESSSKIRKIRNDFQSTPIRDAESLRSPSGGRGKHATPARFRRRSRAKD